MSWDKANEELDSAKASQKKGAELFKFPEGATRIRIVSMPETMRKHWLGGKKSAVCPGKDICPLCQRDEKVSVQFLYYFIDRADGALKIAQFGSTIQEALRGFRANEDYAFSDIPDYDITINRKGTTKDDTEYSVLPSPKRSENTQEEMALVLAARPLSDVAEALGKPKKVEEHKSSEIDPKDLGIERLDS